MVYSSKQKGPSDIFDSLVFCPNQTNWNTKQKKTIYEIG